MTAQSLDDTVQSRFVEFMEWGEPPFNYERKVFESQFERLLRIYDRKITPPYEVEIQPSSSCNINCVWCVGDQYPRLKNLLNKESMRKVSQDMIDFVEDGFGIETVKFSGFVGEPLVNPATIEGLEVFIENGKRVGLFTNGILMDRETTDGRRYLDTICEASFLHVSLDASSETTMQHLKGYQADFERIITNLEQAIAMREQRRTKLEIGVGYIITPDNFDEIYSIATRLKEMGVDFIRFKVDITGRYLLGDTAERAIEEVAKAKELIDASFNVVSVHTGEESQSCEIYDIHRMGKIKCYTTQLWGTVGSDGQLYACDHRTHKNGRPYGDLKTNTFRDIWTARQNSLPDEYCNMCSPFGTRINRFLNFLFQIEREQIVGLHDSYFQGEKR